VVPAKKLKEEALAAAAKIAEKSMITVMAVKEAVNRSYEVPLREGLLFERRVFHSLFATEDQKPKACPPSWKSARRSSATSDRAKFARGLSFPSDSAYAPPSDMRVRPALAGSTR
jgi:hypothetical protein